jgi:adhesin HecA-like repeat protein
MPFYNFVISAWSKFNFTTQRLLNQQGVLEGVAD